MEIFGLIIWFCILSAVFGSKRNKSKAVKSTKQMGNQGKTGQVKPPAQSVRSKKYDQWENYNQSGNSFKQEELKKRLTEKYDKAGKKEIPAKFNATVGERVSSPVQYMPQSKKNVTAAMKTRGKERTAEKNILKWEDNEDLMEIVSDIMAKGTNTDMSFDRDFIAEGMDMLHHIQTI